MFTHVTVGAIDLEASKLFYDAVLATLGISAGFQYDSNRIFYTTDAGLFCVMNPLNRGEASFANGVTIGFAAKSAEEVDAWHQAGTSNGGVTCEDPPGIRQFDTGPLYLAYLRDPVGNKLCAMYRPAER